MSRKDWKNFFYNDPLKKILEDQRRLQEVLNSYVFREFVDKKRTIQTISEPYRILRQQKRLDSIINNSGYKYVLEQQNLKDLFLSHSSVLIEQFKAFNKIFENVKTLTPALRIIDETNLMFSRIIESQSFLTKIPKQSENAHHLWQERIELINRSFGTNQPSEIILGSYLTMAAEASIAVEMQLAQVPWDYVGQTISALPTELLNEFVVDVSKIAEIGEGISIGDLDYDKEKVEIVDLEKDEMVVKLDYPMEEEEEEEVSEEELIEGIEATEEGVVEGGGTEGIGEKAKEAAPEDGEKVQEDAGEEK